MSDNAFLARFVPRFCVVIVNVPSLGLGVTHPGDLLHHATMINRHLSDNEYKVCRKFPTKRDSMIALLQRAARAHVTVDGDEVGRIDDGVVALIGVQRDDTAADARRLLERLLGYRLFSDAAGKMNLSLTDTGGGLLLVPQFTLAADTRKGARPSFTPAAPPAQAQALFEQLCRLALARHPRVATGRFGADMQVSLINDGPVTFWLES